MNKIFLEWGMKMSKGDEEIVSMVIPDTMPGPGTYKVKMDVDSPDGRIPNVTPLQSIDGFSRQGTADDIASTDMSPESESINQ